MDDFDRAFVYEGTPSAKLIEGGIGPRLSPEQIAQLDDLENSESENKDSAAAEEPAEG